MDLTQLGAGLPENGTIATLLTGSADFFGMENIFLGSGDDTVIGSGGNDTVNTGGGNDSIVGNAGDDSFFGAAGNDTMFGGAGSDTLLGASGDDTLFGGGGADFLGGGAGIDSLFGGDGNDSIFGFTGADTVEGGAGDDTINLGVSPDPDNPEADVVIFSDGDGNDIISEFEVPTDEGGGIFTGVDQLDVSNLTDAGGDPVTTADVTVTQVGPNTVLDFPNGESITLIGVSAGDVSNAAQLNAIGIPAEITIPDLIQLDGTVPTTGASLSVAGGELVGIQDAATFVLADSTQIQVGDTAVIGGTTYTVTTVGNFSGTYRHDDGSGNRIDTTDVTTGYIVLDDGASGTISFLLPQDAEGDFPETGIIDVVGVVDTAPVPVSSSDDDVTLICFATGTGIKTPAGEIKVENLQVGQLVETLDHGLQPIRWIGRRKVAAVGNHAPIVFKEDAIGNKKELTVSPQHRMLVSDWKVELLFAEDEVLVAAKHMVNGTSIKQIEGGEVEYFHVLFDRHEIIFADGCATESLHLGDESLKTLGETIRQQLYKEFPTLIDEAKSNKAHTARHCLKGFEAALLFDDMNSLSCGKPVSATEIFNVKLA